MSNQRRTTQTAADLRVGDRVILPFKIDDELRPWEHVTDVTESVRFPGHLTVATTKNGRTSAVILHPEQAVEVAR